MTEPIDDRPIDAGRRRRPSRTAYVAAATSVVAAVLLAVQQSRGDGERHYDPVAAAAIEADYDPGPAATTEAAHPDPARAAANKALVVRDGDTVQASGVVMSRHGEPVRFCAPAPVMLVGSMNYWESCPYYVKVTGVDLEALTDVTTSKRTRQGSAHLAGVWRSGTLAVTEQGPPAPEDPEPEVPDVPPCRAPQGGWKSSPDEYGDDRLALVDYIEQQHPDRFRPYWVTHPDGAVVLVIEVVKGTVTQARSQLEQRYTGNLCVVGYPGRPSLADQQRISATVGEAAGRLMNDVSNGIYEIRYDDTVRPATVLLTPRLYDEFAAIGFTSLEPDPWLRPVG